MAYVQSNYTGDYAPGKPTQYVDQAADIAKDLSDQAGPAIEQAQDAIQQGVETITDTIKQQPLVSIAVVGAAAFALGALCQVGRTQPSDDIIASLRKALRV